MFLEKHLEALDIYVMAGHCTWGLLVPLALVTLPACYNVDTSAAMYSKVKDISDQVQGNRSHECMKTPDSITSHLPYLVHLPASCRGHPRNPISKPGKRIGPVKEGSQEGGTKGIPRKTLALKTNGHQGAEAL